MCTAGQSDVWALNLQFWQHQRSREVWAAHLLGQVAVAFSHCLGQLWELDSLKEGDDLLLPEDAVKLLLQIDEGVGGLAVPDVGLPCLHTQPQVVADDLQQRMPGIKC